MHIKRERVRNDYPHYFIYYHHEYHHLPIFQALLDPFPLSPSIKYPLFNINDIVIHFYPYLNSIFILIMRLY